VNSKIDRLIRLPLQS